MEVDDPMPLAEESKAELPKIGMLDQINCEFNIRGIHLIKLDFFNL